MLAPKSKKKNPMRYSQIASVDGQSISQDFGSSNGSYDLTDIDTSKMDASICCTTEKTSEVCQKDLKDNSDYTSRIDTSLVYSQKDREGNSNVEVMMESNPEELDDNQDENESDIDTRELAEETFIDESVASGLTAEKESSGGAAAAAYNEFNSHFYSSGKVYDVCEEQDPFEIEEYEKENLPLTYTKAASTLTTRLHTSSENVSIPSECLGFCHTRRANTNVLLLSLRPSGQVSLRGIAYVKCLLGSVNILGYKLRQGEKVPLFAPFPEASLVVQGPDAVTMSSDPGKEIAEGHWINFSSKQANQQQSQVSEGSSDLCTVDKIFQTKWMTANGEECKSNAEKEWLELNLVLGERAVVLEVSEFPAPLLDRALRICPGGEWMPIGRFMPAVLHSPPSLNPSVVLTLESQKKKEHFKMPLYLPFSWRQVVSGVCADHLLQSRCHKQAGVRVMVIGGRHVGCNSFMRFLVNSLLNSITSDSSQTTATTRASTQLPQLQASNDQPPTLHATNRAAVCVLDLDPRHSEHSLPGTLSCARYTAPVLGPAHLYGAAHAFRRKASKFPEWRGSHYTRFNNLNFDEYPLVLPEIIKEFLIGRYDLTELAEEYLASSALLVDAHRSQCMEEPLVVNCCSSTDNHGDFRIILELMRFVNPTHVIHIEGKINQETKTSPFNCDRANEELRRLGRFNCDITSNYTSDSDYGRILPATDELTYTYARIPSVAKSLNILKISDDDRYVVTITSYFSALWPHFSPTIESVSLQTSVIIYSHNLALHFRHGGVDDSQLLNAINCAGLVTLCYLDPKHIKKGKGKRFSTVEMVPRGSHKIIDNSSLPPYKDPLGCYDPPPRKHPRLVASTLVKPPFNTDCLFRVHGWAVVRRVDPDDKGIHLLVPGCGSVLKKVNCIVLSDVQLPGEFRWLFYKGFKNRAYETFSEQGPWNAKVKQRTNKK